MVGGKGYIAKLWTWYGWEYVVGGCLGESGADIGRVFVGGRCWCEETPCFKREMVMVEMVEVVRWELLLWSVRRGCLSESGNAKL
jgi:hypothetical protein